MSETRTYSGKFVSTGLTLEDFVAKHISVLPEYYRDCDLMEQFHEISWELCHIKDTSKHHEFFIKDNIVHEVVELEDLQYKSFIKIDEESGTFVTSFYDGGTCLQEMLERGE